MDDEDGVYEINIYGELTFLNQRIYESPIWRQAP